MTIRNFSSMLARQWAERKFLCVGLDIDYNSIPESLRKGNRMEAILNYAVHIVDATKNYAAAYKPNLGFYLADWQEGLCALQYLVEHIKEAVPAVPILQDPKTGDIGTTADRYAQGFLDRLGVDAVTLNPYMGQDTQQVYLNHMEKGCVVLCKTSNKGSAEFQDRLVILTPEEAEKWNLPEHVPIPMYELVAHRVSKVWNTNLNCGVVVGATFPDQMRKIRRIIGDDTFILAPGIGKQGGDLEDTVQAAKNSRGSGFLINASSSINYASKSEDFAEAAGAEALRLHTAIINCL